MAEFTQSDFQLKLLKLHEACGCQLEPEGSSVEEKAALCLAVIETQ